ncbi:MAG TPA: hypothetical protein VGC21_12085 [Telluria sp.]
MAEHELPYFFARLSLDPAADARAIKRAYGRELRLIDQEKDLPAFQLLREAYEAALQWAEHQAWLNQQDAPDNSLAQAVSLSKLESATSDIVRLPAEAGMEALDPSRPAYAVYQGVIARCQKLGDAPATQWEEVIRAGLAEEDMYSLAARNAFENLIVECLAEGWKPGKEKLLAAAAEVFAWEKDHRHLQQFGYAGMIVNNAIDEREVFLRQPDEDLAIDRTIIKRLRSETAPDANQLDYDMAFLERLMARFPHLMALSVDETMVARWRETFVANGGDLKKAVIQGHTYTAPLSDLAISPWSLLFLFVLILRGCF